MGAGASTVPNQGVLSSLPGASNADMNGLANAMQPLSSTSDTAQEYARALKNSLCTPEGWVELQKLFKMLGANNLDDCVSNEQWGALVHENPELCAKYFGDATPDEIAAQFHTLDEACAAIRHKLITLRRCFGFQLTAPWIPRCACVRSSRSNLSWEDFVDGVMSLGAAIQLVDALSTSNGEADLKEAFDVLVEDDGRVLLGEFADMLVGHCRDVLANHFGLDEHASPRFAAFFLTGKVRMWLSKVLRRLGLDDEERVSWDEFMASSR